MEILTKYRNRVVLSVALIFFFIMAPLVFAETKVFVEEYTYQASEADSKLSSRVIALEQIKRLLLEKLGTYLESETEVKNFRLTKDQIVILTAGIVRAEIIEERWDGKTYSLKAKITADPKEVIKSIDLLRQDRQKTKDLEETRNKADEALREVEKLKKELEIAKGGKTEQDQYNKAVNRLNATDSFQKGFTFSSSGKWKEAVEAFTRAIELNPEDSWTYSFRGLAYTYLEDYQQAIRDFDMVIDLKPNNNSQISVAYSGRGWAYGRLGKQKRAMEDYDRAIDLYPGNANAYHHRGFAYSGLWNLEQAIKDLNRAIELNPKLAAAYCTRGSVYSVLGDQRQAIKNYDKAIEINLMDEEAYYLRGIAYNLLGDHKQAIENMKTATKLGNKDAQEYLRSEGISR